MRWLSRFAIVIYLSLLCTPQAFAVQDLRLSPLAETQLQGLLPTLTSSAADVSLAEDNQPPTGLMTATLPVMVTQSCCASSTLLLFIKPTAYQLHQARAPPSIFS